MIAVGDAKKLAFSTSFPPDKIVDVLVGSFTAGASTMTDHAVNHTFGKTMFTQLSYSTDGGTTWNDQGVMIPAAGPVFQTLNVNAYTTSSQVVIRAYNYLGSTPTVTYRVALIWKD
jgi:hypothetical protein